MRCRNGAQCPAYSVQDGYKHARQSHACILQYLQTLSEGSHSMRVDETGSQTKVLTTPFPIQVPPVSVKETEATGQTFQTGYESVQQCKLAERSPHS